MAEFRFTDLSGQLIKYRKIDESKIKEAINNPVRLELDATEPGLCRSYLKIDDKKTLCVLFYNNRMPWLVKSAFITRTADNA
jgi:hypothetical protein